MLCQKSVSRVSTGDSSDTLPSHSILPDYFYVSRGYSVKLVKLTKIVKIANWIKIDNGNSLVKLVQGFNIVMIGGVVKLVKIALESFVEAFPDILLRRPNC